jgi:hypothetical protein
MPTLSGKAVSHTAGCVGEGGTGGIGVGMAESELPPPPPQDVMTNNKIKKIYFPFIN